MQQRHKLKIILASTVSSLAFAGSTLAGNFDIPGGDLKSALDAYAKQSGVEIVYPEDAIKNVNSRGIQGKVPNGDALTKILSGTGFVAQREGDAIAILPAQSMNLSSLQLAQATPPTRAAVETVTVTSSKLGGADVQSIPIAITALSQEQLTATQTAGGPDLVKQVPNLTFTKTNFTGYSINIRGIGTQAISVTTDPAVAVAFNDLPFIRNHFFEQEFYDVAQVEVLRGPQGTLYGRNATAGVVNLTSAHPSDQFEAMASGEIGNYHQKRFEGMINLPIVDDRFDIRIAGEWTKRQGYSFNELTDQRIDGRDLWSGRISVGLKPLENLQIYFVWEHFSEDDDRIRSSKQLCKRDLGPLEIAGVSLGPHGNPFLSQGCLPTSLYGADAFQVVNGFSLPYYGGLTGAGFGLSASNLLSGSSNVDAYDGVVQSRNLRVIQSNLDPEYQVKNDIVELNADYSISPSLTVTSQTGFNHDFLWSTQDYNRFNTRPGVFGASPPFSIPDGNYTCFDGTISIGGDNCEAGGHGVATQQTGYFCDPQLGCSNRLVAQDLSKEHAWQLNQEVRLASSFSGPVNFSVGGNYMHYETAENYYVFINSLTQYAASIGGAGINWQPGVSDNSQCLTGGLRLSDPQNPGKPPYICPYIDPNSINNVNDEGHNYFLSQNPYVLNSYAAFGEVYYNIFSDLKLTGGLRWTEDQKHFTLIPSEILVQGWGYPITGVVDQQWDQFTGRAAVNWTPKLEFTDQTLIYGSYAHGYKAGGANPPGAVLLQFTAGDQANPTHPLTFKPEFIDAFELGTKNTLLDGSLTLNGNVFYYNYENYQISQIVDRTSVNLNFDAHVKGAELEATWEPAPGLRFNFGGGYEDAHLAKDSKAVDLMDRTAGHQDWEIVKPFVTQASNCILPQYVVAYQVTHGPANQNAISEDCGAAYVNHLDPVTGAQYTADPTTNKYGDPIPPGVYHGFDPLSAPNHGAGFDKDVGGNWLPNAPPLTAAAGAQYTVPLSSDWAGTLRADYYWQDYSWARIFNDNPYDRLRGYTNVNLTLILTSQAGWQIMLYDKNVFNTTAITGTFLNSDDTGLTTNVFLTDPKLIGIRVTKNW